MAHTITNNVGPIVMTQVGDEYIDPARIVAVIWEGATSAGDLAYLYCRETGCRLFPGRASGTQTFIGISWGLPGVAAPHGFRLGVLDSGALHVYLAEG